MDRDVLYTVSCPVNSLINVSVVHDNRRTLSAEFQSNTLEVRLTSRLHDFAANQSAPGEGHLNLITAQS